MTIAVDRPALDLEDLADSAADALDGASALEIVRWAAATFGDRICLTSSMTDAALIHLVSKVKPGVDVLFVDTGYHFAETVGTRDAVEAVYPVNVINVTPTRDVEEPKRWGVKSRWEPGSCGFSGLFPGRILSSPHLRKDLGL